MCYGCTSGRHHHGVGASDPLPGAIRLWPPHSQRPSIAANCGHPDGHVDARAVPPGDRIVPGHPRQLVIGLKATGNGDYTLAVLRLTYRTTDAGAFVFASQIGICSGACGG